MRTDGHLEDNLRGLWLGTGTGAYLTAFFPRLDVDAPHLVPIRPGMNVLYGRNGAGKTQMLNALAAASNWEMGPMEGFILNSPDAADSEEWSAPPPLRGMSTTEILEAISEQGSPAVDLGWTWGYARTLISQGRLAQVLAMLEEFRLGGLLMLTRGLHHGGLWETQRPRRELLVKPQRTEFVPVILPDQEAPLVRAHLRDVHDSLVKLLDDAVNPLGYFRKDDPAADWYCENADDRNWRDLREDGPVEEALQAAYEKWREEWGWSPLINVRNIGGLHGDLDDHVGVYPGVALHSQDAAIFLPPIKVVSREPESDFDSGTAAPIFTPFTEDDNHEIAPVDRLEYHSWTREEKTQEEVRESAAAFFDKEVADIRARLEFLPALANTLHFEFDYGSTNKATLMMRPRVPASKGSRAEARWLAFARTAVGSWLFFDEPEAGVHRTAEADLAKCLAGPAWSEISREKRRYSDRSNVTIVVATHSPEFLAVPEANVLHVDDGRARRLDSVHKENLAVLGLRPSDLLSRIQTFLLVEGEHERIVFESLFGDELHRLRVSIVVARGGKNMKDVFDSQVLFNFSDARLVALLDNMGAQHIQRVWQRARELARVGRVDEAGALVRGELPPQHSGENRFLSQFLTRALEDGEHERVGAWGLSKEDIVLYLPPSAFGIKRSWQDALVEYDSDRDGSLKPWLTKKFGASFSLDAVRAAVESLDEIPQDFTELVFAIDLAQSPPSGGHHTLE